MKTVGQIIRETRKKKGLLQRQLAAMLDIDTAILSKLERNERKINIELLLKISEFLQFDSQEMLVQYQSDRIAYEIANDVNASRILKIAEKKINYIKKR